MVERSSLSVEQSQCQHMLPSEMTGPNALDAGACVKCGVMIARIGRTANGVTTCAMTRIISHESSNNGPEQAIRCLALAHIGGGRCPAPEECARAAPGLLKDLPPMSPVEISEFFRKSGIDEASLDERLCVARRGGPLMAHPSENKKAVSVYLDPIEHGALVELAYQDRVSASEWIRNLASGAIRKRQMEAQDKRQQTLPGMTTGKKAPRRRKSRK